MTFDKATLIQTNAIIITGLLILLTIQSVATVSILDMQFKVKFLTHESEILSENKEEIAKALEITYGNRTIECEPTSEMGECEFSIPAPPDVLEELNQQIKNIEEENNREKVRLQASILAYNDLHPFLKLYVNPPILVSILISPFLLSTLLEVLDWFKNKEKPSRKGIIPFIGGLIIMLVFFIGMFFMPSLSWN